MDNFAEWSNEKNEILKRNRWVCFEDVLNSEILDDIVHPNNDKYWNQRILIVKIRDYIYIVPYVENDNWIFLKTIYPDRKYNKIYNK